MQTYTGGTFQAARALLQFNVCFAPTVHGSGPAHFNRPGKCARLLQLAALAEFPKISFIAFLTGVVPASAPGFSLAFLRGDFDGMRVACAAFTAVGIQGQNWMLIALPLSRLGLSYRGGSTGMGRAWCWPLSIPRSPFDFRSGPFLLKLWSAAVPQYSLL